MTAAFIAAAAVILALGVSNILLWRKIMATPTQTETVLATIGRVDQLLASASAASTKIATSVAAIQDASAKIIAAAADAGEAVPQAILDAAAQIDTRAQETLAAMEILNATPGDLDQVTSALLAGAKAVNPVAPLA